MVFQESVWFFYHFCLMIVLRVGMNAFCLVSRPLRILLISNIKQISFRKTFVKSASFLIFIARNLQIFMIKKFHHSPSLFSSLSDMLNQSHPLYKLADKIDWEKFDTAFFSIPPVIMPEEKLG